MSFLLSLGSRVPVRLRLTGWFVAIAVAAASTGVVAVTTMSDDMDQLAEDTDSLYNISLVRTAYTQMRMELMVAVLSVVGQDQGAGFLLEDAVARLLVADAEVDGHLEGWKAVTTLGPDRIAEVEAAIAHHREIVWGVALPLVQGDAPTLDPPSGRTSWDVGSTLVESNTRFSALATLLSDVATAERDHFEQDIEAANARSERTRTAVWGGAAVGVVLAAILGSRIARRFSLSLRALIDALDRVRGRDYTVRVSVIGSDEFARVGEGLNETVATLERQAGELRATTAELHDASVALGQVSDGLASQTSTVSDRTHEASGALTTMSHQASSVRTAIEQMNESIREIASQAAEATKTSRAGTEEARDATMSVRSLESAMASIERSVGAIGKIAEQTNMLALNATIEAARAGEAGRGFAVVAGEVQDLAREASSAATDIEHSVADVRASVDAAVTSMVRVEQLIVDTDAAQTVIASAVEEQTATVNEMTDAVATVARNVAEVEMAMASVTSSADEARNSTELTRAKAVRLAGLAERLRSL